MILIVFGWLVCAAVASDIARKRGASQLLWFVLGLLLGPLAVLCAFGASSNYECPYCKGDIHKKAIRCRHCQANLQPQPSQSLWNCAACGSALQKADKFCDRCGTPIIWD